MVKILSTSGHTTYGLKEYVVDNLTDINTLPINDPMGSTALVIATGELYIMNGNKEWILFGEEKEYDYPIWEGGSY